MSISNHFYIDTNESSGWNLLIPWNPLLWGITVYTFCLVELSMHLSFGFSCKVFAISNDENSVQLKHSSINNDRVGKFTLTQLLWPNIAVRRGFLMDIGSWYSAFIIMRVIYPFDIDNIVVLSVWYCLVMITYRWNIRWHRFCICLSSS